MLRHLRVTVEGHAYDVTVEDLTDTGNQLYPDHRSMVPTNSTAPVTAPPAASSGGSSASAAPAAAAPSAGSSAVLAPMSGVVAEVSVSVGAAVQPGQVVAVMEAMKLKSPIIVDKPGTVASVDVAPGDAVESGSTILTLS